MPEWASCGDIYIRSCERVARGHVIAGHTHTFDHTAFLWSGSIRIVGEGPSGHVATCEFSAPRFIPIFAHYKHEITALEDGTTYYCVFANREPGTGEPALRVTNWYEAYDHGKPFHDQVTKWPPDG